MLTLHVVCSVGLLGSVAAFLALAITGLNADGDLVIRAAYIGMDCIASIVIVPLAIVALLTGIVQSMGTRWGLFNHYWILAKLILTAFAVAILLMKMEMISYAAELARASALPGNQLRDVGIELAVHAAGGLLVLLLPTILSIYKPSGLTPWAARAA